MTFGTISRTNWISSFLKTTNKETGTSFRVGTRSPHPAMLLYLEIRWRCYRSCLVVGRKSWRIRDWQVNLVEAASGQWDLLIPPPSLEYRLWPALLQWEPFWRSKPGERWVLLRPPPLKMWLNPLRASVNFWDSGGQPRDRLCLWRLRPTWKVSSHIYSARALPVRNAWPFPSVSPCPLCIGPTCEPRVVQTIRDDFPTYSIFIVSSC